MKTIDEIQKEAEANLARVKELRDAHAKLEALAVPLGHSVMLQPVLQPQQMAQVEYLVSTSRNEFMRVIASKSSEEEAKVVLAAFEYIEVPKRLFNGQRRFAFTPEQIDIILNKPIRYFLGKDSSKDFIDTVAENAPAPPQLEHVEQVAEPLVAPIQPVPPPHLQRIPEANAPAQPQEQEEPEARPRKRKLSRHFATYDYGAQLELFLCVLLGCVVPVPDKDSMANRLPLRVLAEGRGRRRREVQRDAVRARLHTGLGWVTWGLAVVSSAPDELCVVERAGLTNDYNFTDVGWAAIHSQDFNHIHRLAVAHRALYGSGESPSNFLNTKGGDEKKAPDTKFILDTARVHGEQLANRNPGLANALAIMRRPIVTPPASQGLIL